MGLDRNRGHASEIAPVSRAVPWSDSAVELACNPAAFLSRC